MFGRKLKINKNYGYIYKCIEDLKENIENPTNDFLDKALNLSTYAVLTDFFLLQILLMITIWKQFFLF